ncbi:MAG TPA: 30S ribosomal protein S20 [Bacillota bacterium]
MANIKSAAKRARTAEKRRVINSGVHSRIRAVTREYRDAIAEKKVDDARRLLVQATSLIDSASGRGVIHERAGAGQKSRLAKAFAPLAKAKPKRATRTRKKTAPAPEPVVEKTPAEEKVAAP